jgi:hypothetical protein
MKHARTEATRMFSTIQPGERPNDSSTALEGKRLPKRSAFLTAFPKKQ